MSSGGNLDLVLPIHKKSTIQIPIFDKYKSKKIISNELKTSRIINSVTKDDWLEIKSSIKRLYSFENHNILKKDFIHKKNLRLKKNQ